LGKEEAEAISRLSTLERIREQARDSKRANMVDNVEKLIAAELRRLRRLRKEADTESARKPGTESAGTSVNDKPRA
jgi:hypothetical protein